MLLWGCEESLDEGEGRECWLLGKVDGNRVLRVKESEVSSCSRERAMGVDEGDGKEGEGKCRRATEEETEF